MAVSCLLISEVAFLLEGYNGLPMRSQCLVEHVLTGLVSGSLSFTETMSSVEYSSNGC